MSPDDPRHGTDRQPISYRVPGCDCDHCESARTRWRRQYKMRQLGKPRLVPVAPVAKHLTRLIDQGWSAISIAEASGVGRSTITEALDGTAEKMRITTASALLQVAGGAQNSSVPALGTVRRLQALAAIGWPMREVCVRAGLSPRYGAHTMGKARSTISTDSATAITRIYDELSMTPAPTETVNNHARSFARNRGWAPPLSWTNIDDPAERPAGIRNTTRTLPTTTHRADTLHDIDSRAAGISDACRALNITRDALEKWCERHDLRDLYSRLVARETVPFEYRNGTTGAA